MTPAMPMKIRIGRYSRSSPSIARPSRLARVSKLVISRVQIRRRHPRATRGLEQDLSAGKQDFSGVFANEFAGHDMVRKSAILVQAKTGLPAEAARPDTASLRACALREAAFAAAQRRLAGATGLEPATYGVTGRHSNQLSYAPAGARGAFGAARRRADVRPTSERVKERSLGAGCRPNAFPQPVIARPARVRAIQFGHEKKEGKWVARTLRAGR